MSGQGVPYQPLTPGERVVAVSHTGEDDHLIHIFGSGIYQCEDIVGKEAVGAVSVLARVQKQPAPKIQLDGGNIIWGTECHIMREDEFQQILSSPGLEGMAICDLSEVRAKAPNFLVVKMFIPPNRQVQFLPMQVSNDTFRMMETLESIGRNLHLEGEFLRRVNQFTITLSDNQEDLEIEIVTSLDEPYQEALGRIIERAYKRLVVSA